MGDWRDCDGYNRNLFVTSMVDEGIHETTEEL